MTDYSKMSDFEINKLVAISLSKELAPDACQDWGNSGFSEVILICGNCKDFCNNPSDAWPIIYGELISLSANETSEGNHKWFAFGRERKGYKQVACGNPLRAAMIVYLMMKESENG